MDQFRKLLGESGHPGTLKRAEQSLHVVVAPECASVTYGIVVYETFETRRNSLLHERLRINVRVNFN